MGLSVLSRAQLLSFSALVRRTLRSWGAKSVVGLLTGFFFFPGWSWLAESPRQRPSRTLVSRRYHPCWQIFLVPAAEQQSQSVYLPLCCFDIFLLIWGLVLVQPVDQVCCRKHSLRLGGFIRQAPRLLFAKNIRCANFPLEYWGGLIHYKLFRLASQ